MKIFLKMFLLINIIFFPAIFYGADKTHIPTLFIGIAPVNGAYTESLNINNFFRKQFELIPGMKLLDQNGMKLVEEKLKKCMDRECAAALGKETGSERVIYGTLKIVKNEKTSQIGSEGEKKYLLRLQKNEYFILSVHLVDVLKAESLASFKKVNYGNFNKDVDEIVNKIKEFYKLPVRELKVAEKIKVESDFKKSILEYSLLPNVAYVLPVDKFSSTSYSGIGLGIQLSIHNLLFRNSFLSFDINSVYMLTDLSSIDYYFLSQISILFGYSFHLLKWLDLTPSIGGGYLFHFISGARNNSQSRTLDIFPDPAIKIQLEFGFVITNKVIISLITGYNLFFETSGIGQNLYFNCGVRLRL